MKALMGDYIIIYEFLYNYEVYNESLDGRLYNYWSAFVRLRSM